jgi:hypothetical protein
MDDPTEIAGYDQNTNSGWWRWPWQVYCAPYVLLVKLSAWGRPSTKRNRFDAALWFSGAQGLYLVGLFNWYEVFTGRHVDLPDDTVGARLLWWPPVLLFLFCFVWLLGRSGVSETLESRFDRLSRCKRNVLNGFAVIWLAGLIPFMVFSKNALVTTFNLPAPRDDRY